MSASTFRTQRAAARAAALPEAVEGDAELEAVEDPPGVPQRLRTVAYFLLLGVSVIVGLVAGLAPIWLDPDTSTRVVASAVVVSSVLGTLAGGLGVAYRPTR